MINFRTEPDLSLAKPIHNEVFAGRAQLFFDLIEAAEREGQPRIAVPPDNESPSTGPRNKISCSWPMSPSDATTLLLNGWPNGLVLDSSSELDCQTIRATAFCFYHWCAAIQFKVSPSKAGQSESPE